MPDDELEKIKKLPPEERIRKLKELEEKRKKELTEAEKLIKASIEEASEDEAREKITELVQMGEAKLLQSEAEKRIFESIKGPKVIRSKEEASEKGKSQGEALEETIAREQINPEFIQRQQGLYAASPAMREQRSLYEAINRSVSTDMYNFRQSANQEELDSYYQNASRLKEEKPERLGDNYRKSISEEMLDNTIWARRVLKSMGYERNTGGFY